VLREIPVPTLSNKTAYDSSSSRLLGASPVLEEAAFARCLYLERRRAERNGRRMLLILMDGTAFAEGAGRAAVFHLISERLPETLRDTDVLGWHKNESILGLLLPNLELADEALIRTLVGKITALLQDALGPALAARMQLTAHVFPSCGKVNRGCPDLVLYPEVPRQARSRPLPLLVKRTLDIVFSLLGIAFSLPLWGLAALAVKWSSRGPVLFRQERMGQYGKPFRLLKFRSMYTDCDAQAHEEYMRAFIAGTPPAGATKVRKMTDDPRVTPVGRILRRTSLDELPQLWNVLRGEMSLVGPRPPLLYEFQHYAPWHQRRVLEVKPGVTGLWQVQGRSRASFDEMVRMDLRYARRCTLWLDLKILVRPWAW